MPATIASVDAALKETWTESRLYDQLYNENPLLDRISKLKKTAVGQQAVTPIHVSRNGGYTPLPAAGGTLNTAGEQGLAQATWQYTHHNQSILIQGAAIDGTASDALSVAEVVDLEVTGALDDLRRNLTRQLFMNGTGAICGVRTANSTTIDLEITVGDGFDAIERGWLGVGTQIDVGTTADTDSIVDGTSITSVTESLTDPEIVQATTANVTAGTHFVYIHEGAGGGAQTASREMNGLDNVVDSADTLGGLTVAAQPSWQSYEDTTAQALTLPVMYAANRKVMQKTGKPSNYVVTSLKQQVAFYQQVQGAVRFAGDSGLGAGNVDGVQFNGMTVYAQPDCKSRHMYFLTIEDLLLITAGDPYWQSKVTGGKTLEWIQGTDSYGGKLTTRVQLGARRRNSHAKLSGLT